MGLVITKYENSNDVTFDVSKFDYYYDDDTFPETSLEDFEEIIDETGGTFDVIRQTTTTDGMGNVTNVSEVSFEIIALIFDITKKNRQINDMGLAIPGNRLMYLKTTYNTTDVVQEGDILVDRNSYHWRVIKILKEPYLTATQIYKKAIVSSIGLEGSP